MAKFCREISLSLLLLQMISVGYCQNCTDLESQSSYGEGLLVQGLCNESIKSFDIALQCNPTNARAWLGKAQAMLCLNRYDEATQFCDMAIALNRTYVDAYLTKADAALVQTNNSADGLARSVEIYNSAIDENISSSQIYFKMGLALKDLGMLEEAISSFRTATEINSSDEEAWQELSSLLFAQKRFDEALPAINKSLELNNSTPEVWFMKGTVLSWNSGASQPEQITDIMREAVKSFSRAIELNPANTSAHYQQGLVLLKLNKATEAYQSFNNTTALDINNGEAWIKKGEALFNLGRHNESLNTYDTALSIENSTQALIGKGDVLLSLSKTDEAMNAYKAALSIDQSDYITMERMAHLLYLQGRVPEATYISRTATEGLKPWADRITNDQEFAFQARRTGPLYPARIWVTYGDALNQSGRCSSAIEQYKLAMQIHNSLEIAEGDKSLNPDDLNRSIGMAYFQIPDYESAEKYFRDLAGKNERDIDALFMEGLCMEGMYQNRTAKEIYERILRTDMLHPGASEHLESLLFIPHIIITEFEYGPVEILGSDILSQTVPEPCNITLANVADTDGVAEVSIETDYGEDSRPVESFEVTLGQNSVGFEETHKSMISIWSVPECEGLDDPTNPFAIINCIRELGRIPLKCNIVSQRPA